MKKGFTLIELMIVVAIIAIIAAIAIPNLLESRMQANESNAVAALKQYATAQSMFKKANYGGVTTNALTAKCYAVNFSKLGGGTGQAYVNGNNTPLELIADVFADATTTTTGYQGYYFTDDATAGLNWMYEFGLYADPCVYEKTGINAYSVNTKGTVYMKDLGGTASGGTGQDSTWVVP